MKPERRQELEDELSAARIAEEVLLLEVAEATGLFDEAWTRADLEDGIRKLVKADSKRKRSRSAQLARRLRDAEGAPQHRKDQTRVKLLMGGFLIAQTARHRDLRHDLLRPLTIFLSRGKSRASAAKWRLLLPVYQAWGDGKPAPEGQLRHRIETRGRIVLGTFAVDLLDDSADWRRRLLPEIEPFLAAVGARSRAEDQRVMKPWLAKWKTAGVRDGDAGAAD